MEDHEFKQFVERVKLHVPIEEVVQARVASLKRSGALWEACCPFHEERTPSFKVDPRRGTWHCYGACSDGGDVLSFVQRFDGLEFWDALESLANMAGETMPARSGRSAGEDRQFELQLEVLTRAEAFYSRKLWGPGGDAARAYLEARGLAAETSRAFGLGWAPSSGSPLLAAARAQGIAFELLAAVGLARRNDRGREYDFFHGRLLIPIRDRKGRCVGFGGRHLGDSDGPKYVNTPETTLFKKGRLIYGLDRAAGAVRRGKHLVLAEGYTDVMAAHQVGLTQVAAVLGTTTTEDHAALVRRSGARRVSLIFDGDEAGRRAARRALHGLLPLGEVQIDVVALAGGDDPCELLVRSGAAGLEELLAGARGWFDFLCDELPREGTADSLALAVGEMLEIIERLPGGVERGLWVKQLAEKVGLPEEVLREQAEVQRRRVLRPARSRRPSPESPPEEEPQQLDDPARHKALSALAAACLLDSSLVPAAAAYLPDAERIPAPPGPGPLANVCAVLAALVALHEREDVTDLGAEAVIAELGEHPARELVIGLEQYAGSADSPTFLATRAMEELDRLGEVRELRMARRGLGDGDLTEQEKQRLRDLHSRYTKLKTPHVGSR